MTVIAQNQSSYLPWTTPATKPEKKTYLDRCWEQLDPKQITSSQRSSTLWKIAAGASLVAYTVFALAVFISVTLFCPIYAPVTGLALTLAAPAAVAVYNALMKKAAQAQDEKKGIEALQKHYKPISSLKKESVQKKLSQLGITATKHFDQLKVLLAKRNCLLEAYRSFEKKAKEQAKSLRKIQSSYAKQPHTKIEKNLKEKQKELLRTQRWVLEAKTATAFIDALMRAPHFTKFKKIPKDLYTFSPYGTTHQTLGNACNDPNAKIFLRFKNKKLKPITFKQAQRATIPELGARISPAFS